jgi:hypothetical protein
MKVNGNFVRFGMEVSYNRVTYIHKQNTLFGEPQTFRLVILKEAPPQLVNPKISDEDWKAIKPAVNVLKAMVKERSINPPLVLKQEGWRPPELIRILDERNMSSLTLAKKRIPKVSSLYDRCMTLDLFDGNNTFYLPTESQDENGQLIDLSEHESDLFWSARLPEDIILLPFEIINSEEANYMVDLEQTTY